MSARPLAAAALLTACLAAALSACAPSALTSARIDFNTRSRAKPGRSAKPLRTGERLIRSMASASYG